MDIRKSRRDMLGTLWGRAHELAKFLAADFAPNHPTSSLNRIDPGNCVRPLHYAAGPADVECALPDPVGFGGEVAVFDFGGGSVILLAARPLMGSVPVVSVSSSDFSGTEVAESAVTRIENRTGGPIHRERAIVDRESETDSTARTESMREAMHAGLRASLGLEVGVSAGVAAGPVQASASVKATAGLETDLSRDTEHGAETAVESGRERGQEDSGRYSLDVPSKRRITVARTREVGTLRQTTVAQCDVDLAIYWTDGWLKVLWPSLGYAGSVLAGVGRCQKDDPDLSYYFAARPAAGDFIARLTAPLATTLVDTKELPHAGGTNLVFTEDAL